MRRTARRLTGLRRGSSLRRRGRRGRIILRIYPLRIYPGRRIHLIRRIRREVGMPIGSPRIKTGEVRTTTVSVGIRTRLRMTIAEALGTIVRRVPTGSNRQPRHRRMWRSVCGI